jgi:hypothetical protein
MRTIENKLSARWLKEIGVGCPPSKSRAGNDTRII